MAADEATVDASPVILIESVLLNIMEDDGFALPTQESKTCLEMTGSLMKSFRQRSQSCQTHSNWLVKELNDVICKAKKRGSDLLNEEKLWSVCHQLSISNSFQQTWENFLSSEDLSNEPLLYQRI